jgi:hypothetical protein
MREGVPCIPPQMETPEPGKSSQAFHRRRVWWPPRRTTRRPIVAPSHGRERGCGDLSLGTVMLVGVGTKVR